MSINIKFRNYPGKYEICRIDKGNTNNKYNH